MPGRNLGFLLDQKKSGLNPTAFGWDLQKSDLQYSAMSYMNTRVTHIVHCYRPPVGINFLIKSKIFQIETAATTRQIKCQTLPTIHTLDTLKRPSNV